ncbi:MAG: OmpA family protein [Saprospiraceae bacterium]|nr:OmpA family protein [Saprospiraceae bacterium]MCB9308381.1 OmpA family protein [Lewinellaceae bacterium]MCB9355383.1 OmpA family protein [Lewinellaceae bacterium]
MKHFWLFLFLLGSLASLPAQSIFDSLYTVAGAEVYFDFGKADLRPDASRTLDSVVAGIREDARSLRIRITAHTDSIGSPAANERLSKRRAEALRDDLIRRGLSGAAIEIVPFGERRPAASNATEEGRQQNRRATLDIVAAVPMASLSGQIKDRDSGKGVQSMLTFRSRTREDSTMTDSVGFYHVRLPKDSVVKITAVAPDYFFQTMTMRIFGSPELYKKYKLSPNIELPPAKAGETAVLRDLFFVGDQDILLRVSQPELPKILKFMQINPDLKVEIAGHINGPGLVMEAEPLWRQSLSERRAKLVYDYLLKNGIPAERMTYKGYMNTQMLFPQPKTAQEAEQNRRVEIRVTGKGE